VHANAGPVPRHPTRTHQGAGAVSDWASGNQFVCDQFILGLKWGLRGGKLRCHLCGHWFKAGDNARFQFHHEGNFFACDACDGPDVKERWAAHKADFRKRFWWAP
jgi:hypothetical protein